MASSLVYADVERILVAWLGNACTCRVVTDLPADLDDQVPLLQVTRYGGADERPGLEFALIDVDAYGQDRGSAIALAEGARTALRSELPGTQITDGATTVVITRVDTLSAPSYRPYDNTALRRIGAEYRLYLHTVG